MGDFSESLGFLESARDSILKRDDQKKYTEQKKSELKKLDKDVASMEKDISDEVNSTIKKKRNDIESGFDKKISDGRSDMKKLEKNREKDKAKQVGARVAEATKSYHEENAALEKELKNLFREKGVPGYCSSRFYYTMFMPKGGGELLKKLLYIVLFAAVIPGIVILLLWNTAFKDLGYNKKVVFAVVIAVVWVVLFIVIYFSIYVRTKLRHLETIREGRKYRDAIRKNMGSVSRITDSIEKDKDESGYDLGGYDDKMKKVDKDVENLLGDKKDALKKFDKKTRDEIEKDIRKKNQKKLDELLSARDEAQRAVTEAENELAADEERVAKIAEFIGSENCSAAKIEKLISVMESGVADSVSAAVAYIKINK